MSNVPTGTLAFSMRVIILPRRSAIGTPRRRIPTNPKPSTPPFFSTISYAKRTSVRSISDADISCAFWRRPVLRDGLFAFIVDVPHKFRFLDLVRPLYPGPNLRPGKAASHCIQRSVRGQAVRCKSLQKNQRSGCSLDNMFSARDWALPSTPEFCTLTVRVRIPLSFCSASSVIVWGLATARSLGRIPIP